MVSCLYSLHCLSPAVSFTKLHTWVTGTLRRGAYICTGFSNKELRGSHFCIMYSSLNSLKCGLLCLIFPPALLSFVASQVGVTGTPWRFYSGFLSSHNQNRKGKNVCDWVWAVFLNEINVYCVWERIRKKVRRRVRLQVQLQE